MGMNTVKPQLGVAQTGRKESADIWDDCPLEDILDPRSTTRGVAFQDDFGFFPLAGTQTTQIGFDRYKVFATASGVVAPVKTVNSVQTPGGILGFQPDADNHGAHLAQSYPSFSMTGDATKDGKLWFEACLAVSSVVASHISFLLGLAETDLWTLATGVPFSSDTGAAITNSASFFGFSKPASLTTTVNTAYSDRATSFTAIGTGDVTGLAAFTFFKVGFVYNPADTVNTVKFYLNSVQTATVVPAATITGTTNLKAGNLGMILATQGGSATSSDAVYLDWWRCAQVFPNA